MRYRYLLWDMDGTLFDTYPMVNATLVETFAEAGITVDPAEVARLLTDTLGVCVESLSAMHGQHPQDIKARYEARMAQVPLATMPPFPGVREVCQRVIAAGGKNLIFTHRGRKSLDDFLSYFAMTDLFMDTLTQDQDGGYSRKPDPEGFLMLITRHYIPLKEVLVIGDRDLDIEAGKRAGVATCLYGAEPSPDVEPDYVIQSYTELEAILFSEARD